MTEPFNPIPIPPELKLDQTTSQTTGNSKEQARRSSKPPTGGSDERRSRRSRRGSLHSEQPGDARWQRVKDRLTARIVQIDQEKLKRVLLGLGIIAGLVAVILLLIKLLPAALVLLAMLGVGLALQVWDRLRYYPRPF